MATQKAKEREVQARQIAHEAATLFQDLALRRKLEELAARGPRLTAEFFCDLCARCSITTAAERQLDAFLALDEDALDLLEAWALPVNPIRAVEPDDGVAE